MKNMRRILATLLSAVLLCTLAFGVYADEATEPSDNTAAPAEVQPESVTTETAQTPDAEASTGDSGGDEEAVPPEDNDAADDPAMDAGTQLPEDEAAGPSEDVEAGQPEGSEGEASEGGEGDTSDGGEAGRPGDGEGEPADDPEAQPPEADESDTSEDTGNGNPEGGEGDPSDDVEAELPEDNEGDTSDDAEAEQPGDGGASEDELPAPDDGETASPEDEADAEAPADDVIAADVAGLAEAVMPIDRVAPPTISFDKSAAVGNYYCPPLTVTITAPGNISSIEGVGSVSANGQTSQSFELTSGDSAYKEYTIKVTDDSNQSVQETIRVGHAGFTPGSLERKEPSCEKEGYDRQPAYCNYCGKLSHYMRDLKIDPLGHDWNMEASYDVSGCGGEGTVTVQTCKRCGKTEGQDIGSLPGHNFQTQTTPATCKDPGYTYSQCSKCNYKKDINVIPATGEHTYGEWSVTVPATCEQSGTMSTSCTVCGQTFTRSTGPAKGHNWVEESRDGQSCTAQGTRHLKCSVCQQTRDETIPQLGHEFTKEVVDTAPTCTDMGKKHMQCIRCNEDQKDSRGQIIYTSTNKLGHDIEGVQYTTQSNAHYKLCKRCKQQADFGVHIANADDHDCTTALTCSVCGYTMQQAQSGHDLASTSTADYHSTSCRREGCNHTVSQEAHSWQEADPTDCTSSRTCTVCGYKVPTFSAHQADSGEWQSDGSVHWKKCTNSATCQGRVGLGNHRPSPDDGNCMTPVTCSVCGATTTPAKGEHIFGKPTHSQSEVRCQNPGCKQTQRVEHNMTEKSRTTKQEVSCTQDGIVEVRMECSCGYTETREERTPATGHNLGAWETQTAGSCQSGEIQVRRCQNAGCTYTETQGLQAAGHKFGAPTVTQATCETDGLSRRTCEVCGFKEDTEIPALGHDYKVISSTPATCEEKGIDRMQCTRCKNEYDETSSRPKLGHDFRNYVSNNDASCTKNGTETARCSRCDALDTRDVPDSATGHQYESDGDCTTAEFCLICRQRGASASAHVPGGEWKVDAATGEHYRLCANEGCTQRVLSGAHVPEADDDDCTTPLKCSVCQAVLTPGTQAHSYGAWSTKDETSHTRSCLNPGCNVVEEAPHTESEVRTEGEEASCVTPGKVTHRYYCADCEKIYREETIESGALDHDFTDWEVMESPDCNDSGASRRECRRCGLIEEQNVDPMGHDWNDFFTVDVEPTCERDGSRSIHCSKPNCSATMDSQVIPALGHDFGRSRIVTPAGCLSAAIEEVVCSECGASIVRESTLEADKPLGHSFATYAFDNNATCVKDGTETAKCTRCSAHDTRTKKGSKTGHNYVSDSDCTTPDPCSICGARGPAQSAHKLSTKWDSDTNRHYKLCTNAGCGKRAAEAAHVPAADDNDCTTPLKCAVCGAALSTGLDAHSFGEWIHTGDTHTRYCRNDACNYSESKPHDEVKVDEQVIEAPNCTEPGHSIVITYCSVCEAIVSQEDIYPEATGHKFVDGDVLTSPDCDDPGSSQRVCEVCGYTETTTLNPTGHDWDTAYTQDKAPTCTEDGSESIHCRREGCNATKDARVITALGHDFLTAEVVREANCVEPAVVQGECTRCGQSVTAATGEPLGHNFEEYISDNNGSCTEPGTETAACTRCSALDTRPAPAGSVQHQFVSDFDCTTPDECAICGALSEAQSAHSISDEWQQDGNYHFKACTSAGCQQRVHFEAHVLPADDDDCTTAVTCTVCGLAVAPASGGHNLGGWIHTGDTHTRYCQNEACTYSESATHTSEAAREQVIVAPTCTEDGHTLLITYCADCEAILSQEDSYPRATGHKFGPDTSVSSPDCDDAGSTQRVCEYCGYTETTVGNPLGHDWSDTYTTDKAPTCTGDGSESIHCRRPGCAATKDTRTLAALGHDFVLDKVVREATCVEPELVDVRCTRCDATATAQTGEPLGHDFADYVSDKDASCTEDGTEKGVCTRCDAIDTRPVKGSALGHISDPGAEPNRVVPPGCTKQGESYAICERCGNEFVQSTQKPLGHKAVKEKDLAATCTQGGYTGAITCFVCGAQLNPRHNTPALGHSYGAWIANGSGSHSARCARCGNERTQTCSYSEMHIGGAKVDVCKVCGNVVDSANGKTTTAGSFRLVENVKFEAVDPDAMPAGELIVRELDVPFGDDVEVLEAFTVACELDGEELMLNGKVRVTLPLSCDEAFRLYRVDEVINPETGEQVDELVELEYTYENSEISFETDVNGLFLIVPEDAVEESAAA